MSNQSIELVIKRIAQEDKATKALIQALENKVGPLAYLPTTAKDSIVLALIEIHGVLAGKLTASDIASAFGTTRDEILGGAAASVDTLKELADLWAGQDDSMGDLVNDLSGVLSYTEAQSLSAEQKALVIQSIGAISANAFNILTGRVTEIEGDLSDLDTAATNCANALISLIEAKNVLNSQLGKTLKVDADMGNSDPEKQKGRDNIGIASLADVQALSQRSLIITTIWLHSCQYSVQHRRRRRRRHRHRHRRRNQRLRRRRHRHRRHTAVQKFRVQVLITGVIAAMHQQLVQD